MPSFGADGRSRADHGSYPARLAELAPKYVAAVPKDIFNDAELRYKQQGDGYLLYSVGVNGQDDGAKNRDDPAASREDWDPNWDDLVVRVPAATPQKQKPSAQRPRTGRITRASRSSVCPAGPARASPFP